MKIYDTPAGPFPARVRIALAEKGMMPRVEFVPVDLLKGEHKTPEFRQRSYSGTVPVLELDDGTFMSECTAITVYFDELDGNPVLTGGTPRRQGIVHMMTRRAELELQEAISIYFHHATPGLGPQVEVYQNKEWGLYQRDKALRGMRYFNSVVQSRSFIADDSFSMADIAVLGGLIFAGYVDLAIPADCGALADWHARMQERPSVKDWTAVAKEALAAT